MSYLKAQSLLNEFRADSGMCPDMFPLLNSDIITAYTETYDRIMSYEPTDEKPTRMKWEVDGAVFEWYLDPEPREGGWWAISDEHDEICGVLDTHRLFGRTCVIGFDGVSLLPPHISNSILDKYPIIV